MKPPDWNVKTYKVKGVLHFLNDKIEEPFDAIYNAKKGLSRIDYYDGTVSTFQFSKNGKLGKLYRTVPSLNGNDEEEKDCFVAEPTNGNKWNKIEPQLVFPDLSSFEYAGKKVHLFTKGATFV